MFKTLAGSMHALIILVIIVLVAATIFNSLKEDITNDQAKEAITVVESSFYSGITFFLVCSGIGGTIGIIALVWYFFAKWQ